MFKKLALNTLLIGSCIFYKSFQAHSQEVKLNYKNIVEQCSLDSIHKNLIEFEKLGVKEVNSMALKNTSNWLIDKYKSYGYTNIEKDAFTKSGDNLFNLIVTKTGTIYPDSFLIICGHYDTKNGPGVGDNGSGTVIILELARILKNIDTDISIRFINFSDEEGGLIGSYHYVNEIVKTAKQKIKLVFNIDAVGGVSSKINNKVVCESDQDNYPDTNNTESLIYSNLLASCIEKYSNLQVVMGKTYSSDYMPFQDKGYIITGLYEFNQSPYAHTSNDNLENVDIQYIYQIARGALGASLIFSNCNE